MSEQQSDEQVQQAAQQAHDEIARMHESAAAALRGKRDDTETPQQESASASS